MLLIGFLATGSAGLLTIGLRLDTPWAPWERDVEVAFPALWFTLASFLAALAACAAGVVVHTVFGRITAKPDGWWRCFGVVFLLVYGMHSMGSGTVEAGLMLNVLHLMVGVPALVLLPRSINRSKPVASV